MPLVIAGGANWDSPFVRRIKQIDDPRVKLLGPVYTPNHIRELHCHCYAYVHGNEVGGTNPALLKALGYGNCVLALNVAFNAEVIGDAGLLYEKDPDDLARKMQLVVDSPDLAETYGRRGVARIREAYEWSRVIDGYERLFFTLAKGGYQADAECDDLMHLDRGARAVSTI